MNDKHHGHRTRSQRALTAVDIPPLWLESKGQVPWETEGFCKETYSNIRGLVAKKPIAETYSVFCHWGVSLGHLSLSCRESNVVAAECTCQGTVARISLSALHWDSGCWESGRKRRKVERYGKLETKHRSIRRRALREVTPCHWTGITRNS